MIEIGTRTVTETETEIGTGAVVTIETVITIAVTSTTVTGRGIRIERETGIGTGTETEIERVGYVVLSPHEDGLLRVCADCRKDETTEMTNRDMKGDRVITSFWWF